MPGDANMMSLTVLGLAIVGATVNRGVDRPCTGEYSPCAPTADCSLFNCSFRRGEHCARGEFRCPMTRGCGDVSLRGCGLDGTWLDASLPIPERLRLLSGNASLAEQAAQLTSPQSPPLERLGIAEYNWLSDDEHGVRGWDATKFGDGPALGASFDKPLLLAIGKVVGTEA